MAAVLGLTQIEHYQTCTLKCLTRQNARGVSNPDRKFPACKPVCWSRGLAHTLGKLLPSSNSEAEVTYSPPALPSRSPFERAFPRTRYLLGCMHSGALC